MRRALLAVVVVVVAASLPLGAAEPEPSKRQRELIVELLGLTAGEGTMQEVMKSILELSEKQFIAKAEAQGDVPKDVEERKELYALLHEELARIDVSAALAEPAIRIYAKYYTEREIADLVAFYSTPTGRKSIKVLPAIVRESAEASAKILGPLLEEAASRASDRQSLKRRPWRKVMDDIRTLSTAVLAYSVEQEDSSYPPGDFASLGRLLVPKYLREMPAKDPWGTPYGYVASPDGQHYRIVCAGADRKFEPTSLQIVLSPDGSGPKEKVSDRLEEDIVRQDGVFVQYFMPKR
jgi:hypothetical protein